MLRCCRALTRRPTTWQVRTPRQAGVSRCTFKQAHVGVAACCLESCRCSTAAKLSCLMQPPLLFPVTGSQECTPLGPRAWVMRAGRQRTSGLDWRQSRCGALRPCCAAFTSTACIAWPLPVLEQNVSKHLRLGPLLQGREWSGHCATGPRPSCLVSVGKTVGDHHRSGSACLLYLHDITAHTGNPLAGAGAVASSTLGSPSSLRKVRTAVRVTSAVQAVAWDALLVYPLPAQAISPYPCLRRSQPYVGGSQQPTGVLRQRHVRRVGRLPGKPSQLNSSVHRPSHTGARGALPPGHLQVLAHRLALKYTYVALHNGTDHRTCLARSAHPSLQHARPIGRVPPLACHRCKTCARARAGWATWSTC